MAEDAPLILVVEDEAAQREVLAYNLKKAGYGVLIAKTGDEAEEILAEETPDLILLDWMLPGVSGLELGRRIRSERTSREIPVIMLTARGAEEDVIRALDTGADDYVTKPYSVSELLARIRATLRRSRTGGADVLEVGPIRMDIPGRRVLIDGTEIALGPLEFKLLRTFLERPGRIFERDQLLDLVWGRDIYVGSRTVDVHVGRLRKALGPKGQGFIRTVRGSGYGVAREPDA